MSQGLNQVTLIGYLGRDPETNYTGEGVPVTKFSLAVTERWKDREGAQREHVEWFSIVSFNGTGAVCGQYLSKGRRVYIQGRQRTRTYTNREGEEKKVTEVIALNVIFLDSPKQSDAAEAASRPRPGAPPTQVAPEQPMDEDVPF